jgi:EAL domain-containing protein (putative c-di-GMP-specific phosphodiesterase class I)
VRFPIDVIKIDRLFLKDAPTNREDGSIVRAIVAMSASLGLKVIAEGVETEEQGRFVAQAGCDMVQGHYFHVPMHAQELSRLFVADDT